MLYVFCFGSEAGGGGAKLNVFQRIRDCSKEHIFSGFHEPFIVIVTINFVVIASSILDLIHHVIGDFDQ